MTLDEAFDRLMGHEGGYANNPKDPGGETKYGISKRSYPLEDIKALTMERAKFIWRRDFWDAIRADKLYDGVAYQLSDFAFHSGYENAIRALQNPTGKGEAPKEKHRE